MLPRWMRMAGLVSALLLLTPVALILRSRYVHTEAGRVHPVTDMDAQPKFKPQSANPMFADGRAMRPPVAGTVARDRIIAEPAFLTGREGDGWIGAAPVAFTEPMLRRGQERFGIFCAPCHGLSGYGDGPIGKRADRLMEGTWTPPTNLHDTTMRERPDGHLFNTITNGIRNMPAYGAQIQTADRWAIVGYVRALQRSQGASVEDVPPELRGTLR